LSPITGLGWLGFGFAAVWPMPQTHALLGLTEVLATLVNFTIFLDNFSEGRFILQNPVELTDLRNNCQHKLLSLPSRNKLDAQGEDDVDQCYEICRLACLSYSLLVVFPLPPTVGLFENIANLIELEALRINDALSNVDAARQKLLFWALSMGSIVSIGLPQRQSLVRMLKGLVLRLGLVTWLEARSVLQSFLWHPSTNNRDGEDVWSEIRPSVDPIET
jgi:predicted membrane protein